MQSYDIGFLQDLVFRSGWVLGEDKVGFCTDKWRYCKHRRIFISISEEEF